MWNKQQYWTLDTTLSHSLTRLPVSVGQTARLDTGHTTVGLTNKFTSQCGINSQTGHLAHDWQTRQQLITSQQQDWTLGTRLVDSPTNSLVSAEQIAKLDTGTPVSVGQRARLDTDTPAIAEQTARLDTGHTAIRLANTFTSQCGTNSNTGHWTQRCHTR